MYQCYKTLSQIANVSFLDSFFSGHNFKDLADLRTEKYQRNTYPLIKSILFILKIKFSIFKILKDKC